jgi:hypothetical protein
MGYDIIIMGYNTLLCHQLHGWKTSHGVRGGSLRTKKWSVTTCSAGSDDGGNQRKIFG